MDVQRDSGCFFKTLSSPEHSFGSVYGKQKYVVVYCVAKKFCMVLINLRICASFGKVLMFLFNDILHFKIIESFEIEGTIKGCLV